jgi:hypothetical protein
MVEEGGSARLGPDALPRGRISGKARPKQLDRHRPAQDLVVGPPHHRHSTGAEALDQPVPARNVLHAIHA